MPCTRSCGEKGWWLPNEALRTVVSHLGEYWCLSGHRPLCSEYHAHSYREDRLRPIHHAGHRTSIDSRAGEPEDNPGQLAHSCDCACDKLRLVWVSRIPSVRRTVIVWASHNVLIKLLNSGTDGTFPNFRPDMGISAPPP